MITSTSNAQIKELAKLQKKSRLRDEKGIFLVEGPRMTEEIPAEIRLSTEKGSHWPP